MTQQSSENNREIADRNIERLLGEAYRPEEPDASFVAKVQESLQSAAMRRRNSAGATSVDVPPLSGQWPPLMTQYVGWGVAAALLIGLFYALSGTSAQRPMSKPGVLEDGSGQPVIQDRVIQDRVSRGPAIPMPTLDARLGSRWLSALKRPAPPTAAVTHAGQTVKTGPRERRRVALPDGSVVCLNENTTLRTLADRRVALDAGEIYLDVAPRTPGAPVATKTTTPKPEGTFVVETPARRLTALGTKFSVTVADKQTDVAVVQGRVRADKVAEPLSAGQRASLKDVGDDPAEIQSAPRLAELLYWTRDLMAAAEPVLVPASSYAGGAVTVKSSTGAEEPLSLRRYHVDVHIEDGFARTTIDQTYFNHLTRREEGTFHFPLPPDASISRLAMYVNGKLMEGGMVERDHGRNVFESIKYRMQDPALLEWIDGTTFKMRVFPLEPREEKRIILSYTQPIETLGGQGRFRFPIGHSLGEVGKFSVHVLVRGGAESVWNCATHPLTAKRDGADLMLDYASVPGATAGLPSSASLMPANSDQVTNKDDTTVREHKNRLPTHLEGDLELTLTERSPAASAAPRFSSYTHEGYRYLMLRTTPELTGGLHPERRDWIFVVESSADRSPLLARAQIEIVRGILSAAGHDDTFAIVAAGTRPTLLTSPPFQSSHSISPPFQGGAGGGSTATTTRNDNAGESPSPNPSLTGRGVGRGAVSGVVTGVAKGAEAESGAAWGVLNTPANIAAACDQLGQVHLIGALDLEAALASAGDVAKNVPAPVIVHIGSGVPALGERSDTKLAAKLPSTAQYVGIAVGRSFNRNLMKIAAAGHRGYFTQINPNEPLAWRATDLVTTLNSPRLLEVKVTSTPLPSSQPTQSPLPSNQPTQSPLPSREGPGEGSWLTTTDALTRGETLFALTRLPANQPLPKSVTLTGQLDGKTWTREIPVQAVADGAGYLPRQWARLEIDRLLAADGAKHREEIVKLSKAMYVMSPFTSLLVLENDEMYAQYKVDRGRKDHWAMYPAPTEIPVVKDLGLREALERAKTEESLRTETKNNDLAELSTKSLRSVDELCRTIVMQNADGGWHNTGATLSRVERIQLQEKLAVLVDEFNTFREERRYAEAEVKAKQAIEMAPDEAVSRQMWREVRFWRNVRNNRDLSEHQDDANIASWLDAEKAGMSMEGIPPQQFEDLRDWATLTDRRRKYGTTTGGIVFGPRYVVPVIDDSGSMSVRENTNMQNWSSGDPDDVLAFTTRHSDIDPAVYRALISRRSEDGASIGDVFDHQIRNTIRPQTWDPASPRDTDLYWKGHIDVPSVSQDGHGRGYFELIEGQSMRGATLPSPHYLSDDDLYFTPERGLWVNSPYDSNGNGVADDQVNMTFWNSQVIGFRRGQTSLGVPDYWVCSPRFESKTHNLEIDLTPHETQTGRLMLETGIHSGAGLVGNLVIDEQNFHLAGNTFVSDASLRVRIEGASQSLSADLSGLTLRSGSYDQLALPQGSNYIELYTPALQRRSMPELFNTVAIRELESTTGNGVFLVTQRKRGFQNSSFSLTDLTAYVPGMVTNGLDIQTVLEAEGNQALPKAGSIDPKAADLIAKARAAGWRSVELGEGNHKCTIRFDGTGRFQYERATVDGLKETVICDGANLWHVYPELGLAAQRKFSRVYRGALCRMLPWLLPPVEDLAMGADITAIDERTVAISARRAEGRPSLRDGARPPLSPREETGSLRPPLATAGKPVRHLQLRLVFGPGGQIEQQQLVEMPSGKIWMSVRFAVDGAISVVDGQDKQVARRVMKLVLAGAPDLSLPAALAAASGTRGEGARAGLSGSGLVVVPLPLRTQDELLRKAGLKADSDPTAWDDMTAIAVAAVADGATARKIIQKRFFARGDYRLGFYTLLLKHEGAINFAGEPGGKDEKTVLHPLAVHPLSPLARYIADRIGGDATTRPATAAPSLGEGFLAELDQYGSLVAPLTRYGKLNANEQQTQLDILRRTSTEFVRKARSQRLALHIGLLAERNLRHRDVHLALVDFWDRMGKQSGAGLAAQYEKARQLHRAGNVTLAKDEFLTYHAAALKAGFLPPIDREFYDAVRRTFRSDYPGSPTYSISNERWSALITETADTLRKRNGAAALLPLAWQCHMLGDVPQADSLVAKSLEAKEDKPQQRQATQLLAADYYYRTKQLDKSDALVMKVLTAGRSFATEATRREHEALEIVYADVPEKIDLEQLRANFGALMTRYQKLAEATALPGQEPSQELVGAIVAAADRWRSLDDTPDAACQSAARLLRTLGARDAAWQYLTTPLAGKAHESAPWVAIAGQLRSDGEVDLAAASFRAAWQSEPTNPEILLSHATLLRDHGRPEAAKALYRQIATGAWQQPRFNSVQQQAQRELERLSSKE
ncbi:MAG: FecR domain-containing protein [Planctomycetes bacterium]|nr:FecR domain-containing protein [Planctomycetota bacterium]